VGNQRTTFPRRSFQPCFSAVLALQTELNHLELQWPDRRQQRRLHRGITQVQRLDDTFLQQLLQPLPELLEFRGVRIVQVTERFRRESWNLFIEDFGVSRERVTDANPS